MRRGNLLAWVLRKDWTRAALIILAAVAGSIVLIVLLAGVGVGLFYWYFSDNCLARGFSTESHMGGRDYEIRQVLNKTRPQLPHWTPDGKHIVFTAEHLSNIDSYGQMPSFPDMVYIASSDGSSLLSLSEGEGEAVVIYPSVSPDGSRIAYSTYRHTHDENAVYFEIETATLHATDRRRLTEGAVQDYSPVWSPSGDRIAFLRLDEHDACDDPRRSGVYTMDADGSDVRRMDADGSDAWRIVPWADLGSLAWSPDGQFLAYLVEEQEALSPDEVALYMRTTLYTVKADGSERTRLLSGRNRERRSSRTSEFTSTLAWSPDGQSIAFIRHDSRGHTKLYTIGRDGSGLREVADPMADPTVSTIGEPYTGNVSWSPDGSQILFHLAVPQRYSGWRSWRTLYLVNANGSGFRVLGEGLPHGVLSPDGTRMATAVPYGSDIVLYTTALDRSDARVMARRGESGLVEAVGSWQPGDGPIDILPCFTESGGCLQVLDGRLVTEPCSAGFVVPEPEANLGLVQDCETLSGMRHMLVIRAGDSAYQSHRALNWSARTPITEWERLTIALPGEDSSLSNELRSGLRATELDLSDAIFRGAIPPEIGYLSALESLDLSQSRLEGPIPAELSNLSALKFLNLNNNDLEGVIPAELGNMPALEKLYLNLNQLSGPIPEELSNLQSLAARLRIG